MKENKKKIIIVICLLIVVIVGTVLAILFLNKNNKEMTKTEKNIYEGLAYIENLSLIGEHQKALEESYIKTFKEGNYTLSNPYIVNNPYEIAPLTALIMFETENATKGTVTIKGKDNQPDLIFEFGESKTHYITIWGLYDNYKNQVVIETNEGNKKEIEVNLIKEGSSQPLVTVNENSKKINDFFLIDSPIGTEIYLVDSSGNIRANFLNGISKFITQLDNSHILISDGDFDREVKANGLLEMDMTGKVYKHYKLEYGMSYGAKVLDNGNILYMSQTNEEAQSFDTIIEIDTEGKTKRVINIYDLMKEIDSEFMNGIKDKWGFISGIEYDDTSKEIVVSLWQYSAVIALDYNSGKINWILSDPNNLSSNFASYLLAPSDTAFEYPKGPYAINMTDEGFSLMVTNWDINDGFLCSTIINRKSYVANYKLDKTNKTISETSNFGKDKNYFSYALGDYNHYDNYDLILFGRELVNANYNDSLCELNNYWNLNSKLLLVENNQIIFDATIQGANVIAEKYNINKKLDNSFVDSKIYNLKFSGNKEESVKYEDYKDKIDNAYINNYGFVLEGERLTITASEGEKLLLVSSDNKIYKYEYQSEGDINYYLLNSHNKYFRVYVEKEGELYNTEAYLYI